MTNIGKTKKLTVWTFSAPHFPKEGELETWIDQCYTEVYKLCEPNRPSGSIHIVGIYDTGRIYVTVLQWR